MGEHTASSPLFEKSATDLIARLEGDPSELAHGMAREARELATIFASWAAERPTPEARIAAIQALFALNRRAMDYLSARTEKTSNPPASGPSSRR